MFLNDSVMMDVFGGDYVCVFELVDVILLGGDEVIFGLNLQYFIEVFGVVWSEFVWVMFMLSDNVNKLSLVLIMSQILVDQVGFDLFKYLLQLNFFFC